MCATTSGNQAAGKKGIIDIPPNTVPVPPGNSLQKYLEKAYAEAIGAGKLGTQPADDSVAKLHVPISLFAHVRTGSGHHYAGIHDDEVHFSASLMKVAAMYAAFSLRAEARKLAAPGGFANEGAFIAALKLKFKSTDAVPSIQSAGVGLEPRYLDVLKVTGFGGGTLQVEFNPSFVSHMSQMIVPSNNASAGECIRRLGYAYINVKLMNGGFYDRTTSKGIWLAADFVGGTRVEIDSVNDGKVAQATTSRQMARFFSLIQLGTMIDESLLDPALRTSNTEMKALLKEAHGVDAAWISKFGPRRFDFEGVKVGLANLKPNTPPKGEDVYSEGILLKWNADPAPLPHNLSGDIAVCWQNLRKGAFDTGVPAIAEMIEKAFSNFLNQTPV